MNNTDIKFNIVKTNKSGLDKTQVSNGNIYFIEDTKELYFDFDSKRVDIKDIQIIEKEDNRLSPLFAPLNKFYYVMDTKVLWYYNTEWYQVTPYIYDYVTQSQFTEQLESLSQQKQDKISVGDYLSINEHNQLSVDLSSKVDKSGDTINGSLIINNDSATPLSILTNTIDAIVTNSRICVVSTPEAIKSLATYVSTEDYNYLGTFSCNNNGRVLISRYCAKDNNDLVVDSYLSVDHENITYRTSGQKMSQISPEQSYIVLHGGNIDKVVFNDKLNTSDKTIIGSINELYTTIGDINTILENIISGE